MKKIVKIYTKNCTCVSVDIFSQTTCHYYTENFKEIRKNNAQLIPGNTLNNEDMVFIYDDDDDTINIGSFSSTRLYNAVAWVYSALYYVFARLLGTNQNQKLIWLSLSLMWLAFTFGGYRLALSLVKRINRINCFKNMEINLHKLDLTLQDVATSHILPISCKEKSFVLFMIVSKKFLNAAIVVGVDLYPLSLHSWCEIDGSLLTDDKDNILQFNKLFYIKDVGML